MAVSKQTTFDILKNSILSKPRMMGTSGEKETTEFLLGFLTRLGLQPYTEDVEWSTAFVMGRKIMFVLMGFFVVLFNISLRLSPPINGIVSILLVFVSIGSLILFARGVIKDRFNFLGQTSNGENVICEIQPAKEKEEHSILYFTAHSDSVASNVPKLYIKIIMGIAVGFLIIVFLTISSSIINLQSYYNGQGGGDAAISTRDMIIGITSIIILVLILLNYFTKRVNTSPGATDNGSGSAILLSLAEYFKKNPPKNIHMNFIWCTAEEWGLYGSKGYVKTHKEEIVANKDKSYVINVDMVGSELAYLDKAGLIFKKPFNAKLNTMIAQSAEEAGIETRKFNSVISGNSDHAPFKKEKIEVCMFLAKKDTKIIHSPKDTLENVKPEKLEDAVELIKKVVEKIDSEKK